jgi:hypothetical protein
MFVRNVHNFTPEYRTSHPGRESPSYSFSCQSIISFDILALNSVHSFVPHFL